MARYSHLPIWKAAMDLAVHLEHAVRRFRATTNTAWGKTCASARAACAA